VAGICFVAAGVFIAAVATRLRWADPPNTTQHNIESGRGDPASAEREIEALRLPANKVRVNALIIPGGEMLEFSAPMLRLIELGAVARGPLHQHLSDPDIQNEVTVVLGAVGDESTVPLLIEAYPEGGGGGGRDLFPPEPMRMKVICFTHALTYLANEPIGRSRWGCDFNAGNKDLWRQWWDKNRGKFAVSREKTNATWVPHYPTQTASRSS
jgi:hypothetical protein